MIEHLPLYKNSEALRIGKFAVIIFILSAIFVFISNQLDNSWGELLLTISLFGTAGSFITGVIGFIVGLIEIFSKGTSRKILFGIILNAALLGTIVMISIVVLNAAMENIAW